MKCFLSGISKLVKEPLFWKVDMNPGGRGERNAPIREVYTHARTDIVLFSKLLILHPFQRWVVSLHVYVNQLNINAIHDN